MATSEHPAPCKKFKEDRNGLPEFLSTSSIMLSVAFDVFVFESLQGAREDQTTFKMLLSKNVLTPCRMKPPALATDVPGGSSFRGKKRVFIGEANVRRQCLERNDTGLPFWTSRQHPLPLRYIFPRATASFINPLGAYSTKQSRSALKEVYTSFVKR